MVNYKFKKGSLQRKVFALLSDNKWHCRGHEISHIPTGQYAGGGGIQGLQRGTRTRPGIVIESKNEHCAKCRRITKWDRWTGKNKSTNAPSNIPPKLQKRILEYYGYQDSMEMRVRPCHEIIIDHRFPMERWGSAEQKNNVDMKTDEIQRKFQLLKFDGSSNHNLLKSRACENCIKTGNRGTPFGINFFYHGTERWDEDIPKRGKEAEKGCIGCGWYDLHEWREELNKFIQKNQD